MNAGQSQVANQASATSDSDAVALRPIAGDELMTLVHALLLARRDSKGVIITGSTVPVLIQELYARISKSYYVTRRRVRQAFDALQMLELRGDAAKLRLSGMEVYDAKSTDYYLSSQRLAEDLERVNARNAWLESQMLYLEALKARNQSLEAFYQSVNGALMKCDKNIQSS